MPAAIFGPYDFLNFNGKLFSRKHEHLMFVKYPAPPEEQTVVGPCNYHIRGHIVHAYLSNYHFLVRWHGADDTLRAARAS